VALVQVWRDKIAILPVRRAAEAINLAGQTGLHLKDRAPERLTLDEVVGRLVKGAINLIFDPRVPFENGDEDISLAMVVPQKAKPLRFPLTILSAAFAGKNWSPTRVVIEQIGGN
jgi:hypothetical protein